MTTKHGAKRISGQLDRLTLVEQYNDKLEQRLVLWAAGPFRRIGRYPCMSTWADQEVIIHI
jgi:hypothetical protein